MEDEKFMDLPTRIEEDYLILEDDILMDLSEHNAEYAELQRKLSDIKNTHPFIETLLGGRNQDSITLSADEYKILAEYIEIYQNIDRIERTHIYFMGGVDAAAYLKKIKAV